MCIIYSKHNNNDDDNNKRFLKRKIVSVEIINSKRIHTRARMNTRTHARTHTRTHTHTGTCTHEHTDCTKLTLYTIQNGQQTRDLRQMKTAAGNGNISRLTRRLFVTTRPFTVDRVLKYNYCLTNHPPLRQIHSVHFETGENKRVGIPNVGAFD